uniref:Uncharacterized protein n=1 Tax=Arundo donax TaxID=35708 RepID=A0A0A9E267_ARUDO
MIWLSNHAHLGCSLFEILSFYELFFFYID